MDRVIFLDIDGVLNSSYWNAGHQKEISAGMLIDLEKIRLLGKLVRNTKAEIILHSGWKFWFDPDLKPLCKEAAYLQRQMQREGLMIAGTTPDHSTEEIRISKKFSLVKAGEILAWLDEHKEVDRWIVLDDLDLHDPRIEIHQLRTDPDTGLTEEDVQRAEAVLLN